MKLTVSHAIAACAVAGFAVAAVQAAPAQADTGHWGALAKSGTTGHTAAAWNAPTPQAADAQALAQCNKDIPPAIPTGSGQFGGPDCAIVGDKIGAGQCAAMAQGDGASTEDRRRHEKLHETPNEIDAVYSWAQAPQLSVAVLEALTGNTGHQPHIVQQFCQS